MLILVEMPRKNLLKGVRVKTIKVGEETEHNSEYSRHTWGLLIN